MSHDLCRGCLQDVEVDRVEGFCLGLVLFSCSSEIGRSAICDEMVPRSVATHSLRL